MATGCDAIDTTRASTAPATRSGLLGARGGRVTVTALSFVRRGEGYAASPVLVDLVFRGGRVVALGLCQQAVS